MRGGSKNRSGRRGGGNSQGFGARGSDDDRHNPEKTDRDFDRDLRDLYDEEDPAGDEYVWPESEEPDDD